MRKTILIIITALLVAFAGTDRGVFSAPEGTFARISEAAPEKGGVKEITYEQFMKIRNSGEKFILLDVLSADSYRQGHIQGARSFPLEAINRKSAEKMIPKGTPAIVYCGSFQCAASTAAAKKLGGLGYNVLDYKGGLKEWQDKGNKLVK